MHAEFSRIVALGASNLTRSFSAFVSVARAEAGPGLEVVAAMGHGRSYGIHSRVGFRTLPGILESGIWPALQSMPPVPTRALVSDVGNDILYGLPADRILALVEDTLSRLTRSTRDIVVMGLPLESVRELSGRRFLAARSLLFPRSRLSHAEVISAAERVEAGLEKLAAGCNASFHPLDRSWYGLDPIHIRRKFWCSAWREILCARSAAGSRSSFAERLNLCFFAPEKRWLFGMEQFTPQRGRVLSSGVRIWLY